ncbi:alpha-glycosidase [Rhizocola hellebori]|uniref:Alpha-glycosidase n=1 Tax=Rhizocola hellebori TaxID=1392758 RepID=A0A8J3QKL5_9ACTN|nr:glycoside hydrolase family 13 protein [Rhizocola hellebori]GIH10836.1 alpha-glycosidase [Rhizocola hellebori]
MRFFDHPHHDGSALYVHENQVWVRVPAAFPADEVLVRCVVDGEPRYLHAAVDRARAGRALGGYGADDTWWTAVLPAHNPVTPYRFKLGAQWLTAAGLIDHDVPDTGDFKLVTYDPPPAWMADAIVYEIFPDRFAGSLAGKELPDWALAAQWDTSAVVPAGPGVSEQFFGGDLDGITARLDHIASLGANTVYLTPIFPSRSNHRYDASTFSYVDPLLGGDEALKRLAEAVHSRGMRLIGDITTNHVGDAHEWFTDGEAEMFYWLGDGDYESWCGVKSLPKLNWNSPLVWERMTSVMRRWLEFFDGWRVDVANMTGRFRDDNLTHHIAASLRRALPADASLVAEHNHDSTGDLDRDGWHGTMNYGGFLRPVWSWLRGDSCDLEHFLGVPGNVPARDGLATLATMRAFASQMSWRSYVHSWQLLDSHDSPRVRTVVGSREAQIIALGLQATMPGTPMIFAGSEFGLTGVNGEHSRTPMPWNRPDDRCEETLAAYQALFGLRAQHAALRHGGLRWIHADADSLVFLRETEHESIVVAAWRAGAAPALPLPATPLYSAPGLTIGRVA